MSKIFIATAGALGALAVGLGAFGAHGLKKALEAKGYMDTFETAVKYHFYHTLALLVVGVLLHFGSKNGPMPGSGMLNAAGYCFIGGTLIFCGALYTLSLTGFSKLGAVAPIGGLLLIVGWVCLLLAALKL